MPRLLFSSLPPHFTTSDLTTLLSSPPPGVPPPDFNHHLTPKPTDVKVLLTKQGRSRCKAFVGYKLPSEAEWACKVWQGSWLGEAKGGSSIAVEWAKSVSESAAMKTQRHVKESDHSEIHEASTRPVKRRRLSPSVEDKAADPRFTEFMQLMQPRKSKALAPDLSDIHLSVQPAPPEEQEVEPPNIKKPKEAKNAVASSIPPPAAQPARQDDAAGDEALSDMEYMRRRMKKTVGDGVEEIAAEVPAEKEWKQESEPESPQPSGLAPDVDKEAEQSNNDEATILESARLFLRNLPYSATNEELDYIFAPHGSISQIHLPVDAQGKPKGIAYVKFDKPRDAVAAWQTLDQTDFQGRLLHILPAITRDVSSQQSREQGVKSHVQQTIQAKRKSTAAKEWSWASLYMNADAVANAVATKLGLPKSELFDPTSSDAAVKLAIAETSVITDTKTYLAEEGINLAAFGSLDGSSPTVRKGRSTTGLLLKNLPSGTSQSTVQSLVQPFGEVLRVLVPPAGTVAVIEFQNDNAAGAAFRGLSFKRLGNSVVYVEKAPADMWDIDPSTRKKAGIETLVATNDVVTEHVGVDTEEMGDPGTTLYVKNLAWATTTATLHSTFSSLGGYSFSRVATKPDPKRSGQRLSMGFGFIGFATPVEAERALSTLQGRMLDDHRLDVKFAQRGQDETDRNGKEMNKFDVVAKSKSNKLMVKNLPFEASKKQVRELFSNYGTIKSVRLPKKLDRSSRGFAFVEYTSKKEAELALVQLSHSHLLGRHLIVTYADDEECLDVDVLRTKSVGDSLALKEGRPAIKKKFLGLDVLGLEKNRGDE